MELYIIIEAIVAVVAGLLIAICIFSVLLLFSRLWLRTHEQGPLEWLWKKGTWMRWR